jgi:hypothetical protein
VTQEEHQDTRETDALSGEVTFDREDVQAVGDPAAASVAPEPGPAATEPDPTPAEPAAAAEPAASAPDPEPALAEDSPLAAQQLGEQQAESPPFAAIGGAFVGAFVAAKLLGKLGGGDD